MKHKYKGTVPQKRPEYTKLNTIQKNTWKSNGKSLRAAGRIQAETLPALV